jgi:SAM-dependent methyltransferase
MGYFMAASMTLRKLPLQTELQLTAVREWFRTPLGNRLMAGQQAVLDQLLPGFFGHHLLEMSIQSETLVESSPIQHKIKLGISSVDRDSLIASGINLPFENDSMDLVLLHHMLDLFDEPQQLLREVSRVALPMGHLVIIGFNPYSSWGVWHQFARFRKSPPWNSSFFSPVRMMDWLKLLNFEIDRVHYSNYGLPVNNKAFINDVPDFSRGLFRDINLPFGAVYVIVARKHVGALTPIRPIWKQSRAFPQLTVVRPMGRNTRNPSD